MPGPSSASVPAFHRTPALPDPSWATSWATPCFGRRVCGGGTGVTVALTPPWEEGRTREPRPRPPKGPRFSSRARAGAVVLMPPDPFCCHYERRAQIRGAGPPGLQRPNSWENTLIPPSRNVARTTGAPHPSRKCCLFWNSGPGMWTARMYF